MAGRSAPKTVKVQDSFQCLQYLGYITLGTIWHPALCIHSNICALWQSAISQSNSSLLTRKCLGIKKSFCSDILFCVYHHHITLSSGTCIGGHSITVCKKRWSVESPRRVIKGLFVCQFKGRIAPLPHELNPYLQSSPGQ